MCLAYECLYCAPQLFHDYFGCATTCMREPTSADCRDCSYTYESSHALLLALKERLLLLLVPNSTNSTNSTYESSHALLLALKESATVCYCLLLSVTVRYCLLLALKARLLEAYFLPHRAPSTKVHC